MTESSEGGPSVVGGVAGGGGVNGAADVGASDQPAAVDGGVNCVEGGGANDPPRSGDEQKALLHSDLNGAKKGATNGSAAVTTNAKLIKCLGNCQLVLIILLWLSPLIAYIGQKGFVHWSSPVASFCDDSRMQILLKSEIVDKSYFVPCEGAIRFNKKLISSIVDEMKGAVIKPRMEPHLMAFDSFIAGTIRYHRALSQSGNERMTIVKLLFREMRPVQCKGLQSMEGPAFSFPLSMCAAIKVPDNTTMTIEEFTEYSKDVATRYRFAEFVSLFYSLMNGNHRRIAMDIANRVDPTKWDSFFKPIEEIALDQFLINHFDMMNSTDSSISSIGIGMMEYTTTVVKLTLEKLNQACQTDPLHGETWIDFMSLPFIDRRERMRECTGMCGYFRDQVSVRKIVPSSYLNDAVFNAIFWTSVSFYVLNFAVFVCIFFSCKLT